jgi:hypothetical protein
VLGEPLGDRERVGEEADESVSVVEPCAYHHVVVVQLTGDQSALIPPVHETVLRLFPNPVELRGVL